MSRLAVGHQSRIVHDPRSGALRSWLNLNFRPATKAGENAQDTARTVLTDSADLFKWQSTLADIVDRGVVTGSHSSSVRFFQSFKKLPVDTSDIVVNLDTQGRLHSIYNNYHYDIPDTLDPAKVQVTEEEARRLAIAVLEGHEGREPIQASVIVYQYQPVHNSTGKPARPNPRTRTLAMFNLRQTEAAIRQEFSPEPGRYYIAWDVRIVTANPRGSWRILIDAVTANTLNVIDLLQYAAGTVQVFDPNPIVTSGNTALRHNSPSAVINAQRVTNNVNNLNPAIGGNLELHGPFVQMREEESPTVAEPTSPTGTFEFSWDNNSFLDAMTYFHLNRFQDYIQNTLAINNAANYSIPVDPQGLSGVDNSHYSPGGGGTGYIAFGGGLQPIPGTNPIPDAADAMVVLHEYGHAIQDNSNPGFDNPAAGTGEGFGDTLAAIFYDDKHANPGATRGFMMSWDSEMGTGSWTGRVYNLTWLFDGPEYASAIASDNHTAGQLWCTTMFELYRKLGGDSVYSSVKGGARDLSLRLHLMANFNVPTSGSTAAQMGQQIEIADTNLGGWRYANGLHRKVIYDTFRKRHLAGYPDLPVDVYINDGRNGGYGSLTGNDLFTERLWLDGWWETQDIWVKVVPYASDADQQAGDPGDHVEPPVGSTAYLYVRVKNKGTNSAGSGPITVKAFHADPGIGLTWPDNWAPMDTPSITVANVLPGAPNHVVVGPFPWTPTVVGHECVVAVVECANDHAIEQDLLATDHVADGDLVPFDNNMAQRNLAPTPAKRGGVHKFVVRNPLDRHAIVELLFDSTLPKGWQWRFSEGQRMSLGPRETRWVEVTIDQASGPEITRFNQPYQLAITGLIEGKPIGGMTFYLAPPSAFPGSMHKPEHRHERHHLDEARYDLLALDIPWRECEVEGQIELKLRFKR
jgi:zinc metalloprotease ZmpB